MVGGTSLRDQFCSIWRPPYADCRWLHNQGREGFNLSNNYSSRFLIKTLIPLCLRELLKEFHLLQFPFKFSGYSVVLAENKTKCTQNKPKILGVVSLWSWLFETYETKPARLRDQVVQSHDPHHLLGLLIPGGQILPLLFTSSLSLVLIIWISNNVMKNLITPLQTLPVSRHPFFCPLSRIAPAWEGLDRARFLWAGRQG